MGSLCGTSKFRTNVVEKREHCLTIQFMGRLINGTLSNATTELLPFYINAGEGNLSEATQCMTAGDNGR